MFITLLPTKLIKEKLKIDISIPANALFSNIIILAFLFCCALLYSGRHVSFCIFKTVTGIPCPGCGITRAAVCLLSGDISNAFLYNPCAILLVLIIAVQIPVQILTLGKKLTLDMMLNTGKILTYVFVAALIFTWVMRLLFIGFPAELQMRAEGFV